MTTTNGQHHRKGFSDPGCSALQKASSPDQHGDFPGGAEQALYATSVACVLTDCIQYTYVCL